MFPVSGDCNPSVSPGAVDLEGVSSVHFGDDVHSDVYMVLSRFQPLNRPHLQVDISSDSQIVVKLYDAPPEPLDMSMVVDRVAQLSQVSHFTFYAIFNIKKNY